MYDLEAGNASRMACTVTDLVVPFPQRMFKKNVRSSLVLCKHTGRHAEGEWQGALVFYNIYCKKEVGEHGTYLANVPKVSSRQKLGPGVTPQGRPLVKELAPRYKESRGQ